MVERRIMSQNKIIQTAKEFSDFAVDVCDKFNIFYIPQVEINKNKKTLDKYWTSVHSIVNSRGFHLFEAVNDKILQCAVTSLGDEMKQVRIFP